MNTTKHIRGKVARILGEGRVEATPISTGTYNTSFWLTTEHQNHFVLRMAPSAWSPRLFYERNMMQREPGVHDLVRQKTRIPVPEVVHFDSDGAILGRPFILMTALPGQPLSDVQVREPQRIKFQLGEYLSQLHTIQGEKFGYLGPCEPMTPQGRWNEAFAIMWRRLMDDIGELKLYSRAEIRLYQQLLDRYIGSFSGPSAASLLHMDLWVQNILSDGCDITGLIDWERSLWGDPQMDLALVERSCLIDEHFWQGYGGPPVMDEDFFVRRAFYLLYEHQKHIFIYAARYRDMSATLRHLRECRDQLRQMLRGDFGIEDPRRLGVRGTGTASPSGVLVCRNQCWQKWSDN